MSSGGRGRRWIDALLVAAILLTVALLYRKATRLWWIWDDTYLLHIVSEHRILDYFVDGSVWLSMPQQLFTPLLTASYDAELALFGPNPIPFYLVHLTELAASAIALAFALRLWMSRAAAACASFLFLVGTPVAVMAAQLMLMHYIESVILSTVAAALFAYSMRSGRKLPAVVSALLYLLAMLAKEIAVPLLPVLLILPERDLRARLRAVWPHGLALVIYFAWRYAILGKIGGYVWTFGPGEIPLLLLRTVARIFGTFAGPRLAIGIPFVLIILIAMLLRLRSRFSVLAITVAFGAAIGPIIPVAMYYDHRFAWCAWICTAIVFAVGTDTLRNRRLALSLMVAAPLLGAAVNRQQWKSEFTLAKRMSDEGRVFTELAAGDFIRMPAITPGVMFQVAWVKEFLLHRPAGTLWFYDDLYLCSGQRPRRVFGFDERTKEVREITAQIPAIASRYCASFRLDQPLEIHAHFDVRRHLLTWDLSPYDNGYTFVSGNGFLAYEVQRHGGLQLFGMKDVTFRVRYRSPRGWVTYSPEFSLDFSRDRDLTWRR
jgi:hypothetical protein